MWVKPDKVVSDNYCVVLALYRGQWREVRQYSGWTGYAVLGALAQSPPATETLPPIGTGR